MKQSISPELIRKYLAGNCSAEEAAKVLEWYDSAEQDPDPLDRLTPQERVALKEMMYTNVMEQIRSRRALPSPVLFGIRRQRLVLGGMAAAIGLFAAVTLLLYNPKSPSEHTGNLTADAANTEICLDQTDIVVENSLRTIKKQILSDGSVIWLQPETWISFPKEFASDKREVRMSGEAFFEVSTDTHRPFVVYSGGLVTQVLGTSFNIKAYKDGPSAEVSVFTGKVSVSLPSLPDIALEQMQGQRQLFLTRHEKAVFSQRKKSFEKTLYNTQKEPELNIWKKNTISFANTPVKEVVTVLNDEFDVELQVAREDQELNNYMLKADFTNQNLPDILQMLEKSLNLTYEIEGKDIILKLDN